MSFRQTEPVVPAFARLDDRRGRKLADLLDQPAKRDVTSVSRIDVEYYES